MTAQKLAEALENIFQEENDRLLNSVRALQAEAVRELSRLIERPRAGLITDENGKVIVSGKEGAENRARIGRIKAILKTFIQGARGKPGKLDKAKESYLNAFKAIEEVQARYFKENFKAFVVRPLKALTKAAQFRTAELLSTGLTQELTTPLYLILDQALRGASLKEINERAREELETTFSSGGGGRRQEVKSRGRLESYANRIVRDTLNNFSGNLTTATAESLGLEWFYYSAGKVQGSRPFCLEREGKYFHREEVERWAALSWEGKNPQTNEDNILALRGGYNCMHSIIPVSKDAIPENRDKVVKPPAESGREAPEQAQESQAFFMPKTPEEAIKRGKKTLEEAKKIIGKDLEKIKKLENEVLQIEKDYKELRTRAQEAVSKYVLNMSPKEADRLGGYEIINNLENQYTIKAKQLKDKKKTLLRRKLKHANKIQSLFLKDENTNGKIGNLYKKNKEWKTKEASKTHKLWFGEFMKFVGPNYDLGEGNFLTYVDKSHTRAAATKQIFQDKVQYAYLYISSKTSKDTFMHEMGHCLEFYNNDIFKLVKTFYEKRTKGDKLTRINETPNNSHYGDDEVIKRDKWIEPYMGKDYGETGGTFELLPMFLSYLYDGDIVTLIDKDPEYFQFFAGIFGNQ